MYHINNLRQPVRILPSRTTEGARLVRQDADLVLKATVHESIVETGDHLGAPGVCCRQLSEGSVGSRDGRTDTASPPSPPARTATARSCYPARSWVRRTQSSTALRPPESARARPRRSRRTTRRFLRGVNILFPVIVFYPASSSAILYLCSSLHLSRFLLTIRKTRPARRVFQRHRRRRAVHKHRDLQVVPAHLLRLVQKVPAGGVSVPVVGTCVPNVSLVLHTLRT